MKRSLAAVLALIASPALSENCDWFDAVSDTSGSAACEVVWQDEGATIRLSGETFDWVEQNRQGQWSTGLLNGRPAVRYEIDRTRYSYSTLDLTLFLDTWQ